MTIEPDTKDWTWVLRQLCAECGEDIGAIQPEQVPGIIRDTSTVWAGVLARPDVRERPAPEVWSPLEYACHVRDVIVLFDQRLGRMVDEDGPRFVNWDQDATATASRYDLQDPDTVSVELREAAEAIAARFEGLAADEWRRTGRRSDGAVFTVGTLSQYLLHDVLHHMHDVGAPRAS